LKRRGGVPSGAAQVIAIVRSPLPEITGIAGFNMEMSLVFSSCMPVAAGIVNVFMGNHHFITFPGAFLLPLRSIPSELRGDLNIRYSTGLEFL
jgi:hypothetical protein